MQSSLLKSLSVQEQLTDDLAVGTFGMGLGVQRNQLMIRDGSSFKIATESLSLNLSRY